MSRWRTKIAEVLRSWQRARGETKHTKDARRDERQVEELDRSRAGDRFPPMGG
jgi:hypothetical protein